MDYFAVEMIILTIFRQLFARFPGYLILTVKLF
jgi:hypothetical protein